MHHHTLARAAAWALLSTTLSAAFAHGDGRHGQAPHAAPAAHAGATQQTAFGRPGDPARVTRSITVDMADTMRFSPDTLTVARGETVRLKVANRGRLLHELVLGTPAEIRQHGQAMQQHPGMAHEAAHMLHVQPGRHGEIVWQFNQPGEFQFACLLPGHFEAGMVGKVLVR